MIHNDMYWQQVRIYVGAFVPVVLQNVTQVELELAVRYNKWDAALQTKASSKLIGANERIYPHAEPIYILREYLRNAAGKF